MRIGIVDKLYGKDNLYAFYKKTYNEQQAQLKKNGFIYIIFIVIFSFDFELKIFTKIFLILYIQFRISSSIKRIPSLNRIRRTNLLFLKILKMSEFEKACLIGSLRIVMISLVLSKKTELR